MKKKKIFLFALAIVLILATSISGALAYFTTYAEGKGGVVIQLGDTYMEQDFSNWQVKAIVGSTPDSQPVYVRARAFAGDQFTLVYGGDGWTRDDDGYYNYDEILYGGERTSQLLVQISNIPEGPALEDSFNVVVIYETTPVQYHEDGTPYADWNIRLPGGNEG